MANVWVLQDMIATQAYPGRSKDTRVMRQFAKQFFQWRLIDGCTIKEVTERFKILFRLLDCLYGLVVSIGLVPTFLILTVLPNVRSPRVWLTSDSQPAWEGRDDAWNKIDQRNRSGKPVRPMFHNRETGKIACGGNPDLAFPIEIVHDHLWFQKETCVDLAINQIFGQTMT